MQRRRQCRSHVSGVLGQVLGGEQPVVVGHVGGDPLGDGAAVEGVGTIAGDHLERLGEMQDVHDVACTEQPAVLVVQGCIAVGLPAVHRLVDVAEVLGGDPTEQEALSRRLGHRGDDLAPRHSPVPLVDEAVRSERPRCRDRTVTDPQAGSAAVLGDDASHTGAERSGSAPRPGISTLPSTVTAGEPSAGASVTGTSAERCHTGLAHHGHEDGGEAGIHGIATEFGDVQPRVDGDLVACRHRDPRTHGRHHRRHRRSRSRAPGRRQRAAQRGRTLSA